MAPVLEIRGLTKSYGPAAVLVDVDLELHPGEIHALLGENGAGKSTLIKILAGVVGSDAGEILVQGNRLPASHSAADAHKAGIAFVHQDLGLIDGLSVAENVALHTGYLKRRGAISFRRTERSVNKLLEEVGAEYDSGRLVSSLSRDEKVLCALARAFAANARIIVLDEVSASLPAPELERLSAAIRTSCRNGVAYIYVTHRLGEVFTLADQITILRDGRRVLAVGVPETNHDSVVRHILGAELEQVASQTGALEVEQGTPAALQINDLCGPGLASALNLQVFPGEILGICGLVGSGTRAVAQLLVGEVTPTGGAVTLYGDALKLDRPDRMAAAGVACVPGDRQRQGIFPTLSIRENLFPTRRATNGLSEPRIRRPRGERERARELCGIYDVRPRDDVEMPVSQLSGGNQQKVVFGRALRQSPRLLVLEDPTAGVDVGSRAMLYQLIRDAAKSGTAVLMISTDFEEIAAEADRVLIMADGEIAHELRRDELTADKLASLSFTAARRVEVHAYAYDGSVDQ